MNTTEMMKVKGNGWGGRRTLLTSALILFLSVCVSATYGQVSAVKAITKAQGFYRVSGSELAAKFSKTVSEIQAMPLSVLNMGDEVASIRDGADIVFYADSLNAPYTDENVFWIVPSEPSVIPKMTVGAGTSPFQSSFPVNKRFEQNLLIRADLVNANVNESPMLWRMLTSGLVTKSYTTTITLDALAAGTGGTLSVRVKGATDVTGRYYHRARIDLNGVAIGFIDFQGLESKEVTFNVAPGQFLVGNNTVKIESTPPSGTSFDSFFLDYYNVNYQRTFSAVNNQIIMPILPGSIEATGFASDSVLVWNVSDQWNIRGLTGHQVVQDGGTLWKVRFNTTEQGKYAITVIGSELTPVRLVPYTDIGLRDTQWQLDHLVITHPALREAAETLSYYRESMGLDSVTITVDDIYDAFNYGIRDARAIDRFLKYAYRNWSRHPRYVVLVGDGSLDHRNELGYNDSLIPAFPLIGPNGLYASDFSYGDPTGTGQVEIAVGRIPVNTPALVNDYLTKMINYETGGNWRTNKLVSTDMNDYGGDFLGIGNELSSIIDGNIYRADLTTQSLEDVRSAVIGGINQGREVSMYVGHGTVNQLSLQSVLLVTDMPQLTNSISPTAFVAIGCLIGAFNDPGKVNLGEGLVTASGGATTVIAAGTLISAADGKVFSERFLDDIYKKGVKRIGDAWISGKNQLTASYRGPAFQAFQLLGDPASAVGDAQSPREGDGAPTMPGFSEWSQSILAPVREDMGQTIQENGDEDGDNFSNYAEYKAGTDPFDKDAFLEVVKIKRSSPQTVELRWPSASLRTYTIEAASNVNGPYTMITNGIPASAPININDFIENSQNPRFYRVAVE